MYNKATIEIDRVIDSLEAWDPAIIIIETVERALYDPLDKEVIERKLVTKEAVDRRIKRFNIAPARVVAWTKKRANEHAEVIFMRADAMYT